MDSTDFAYVVESSRGARAALSALWRATVAHGWVVVGDYDLSSMFSGEGDPQEVKRIDICRPEFARAFVAAEPLAALCMPCGILVYGTAAGATLVSVRPSGIVPRLFPGIASSVGALPARVDGELLAILRDAA